MSNIQNDYSNDSIINFPNNEKTRIEKFDKLGNEEIDNLFQTIYDQIDLAYCYYNISGWLFDKIESRYINLENKWYIYAIDSFEKSMELILDKLYESQKNSNSIFNILSHYSIAKYYNKICDTPEKQKQYQDLINDYNCNCSKIRHELILRRNNFQVHLGNGIFDKNYMGKYKYSTQECQILLNYANNALSKLYRIILKKSLSKSRSRLTGTKYLDLYNQVENFISNLDKNGN